MFQQASMGLSTNSAEKNVPMGKFFDKAIKL